MNRWSRFAPLTGLVYLALILVTFFGSPNTPNSDATGQHVISFYEAHRSAVNATSFIGVFAMLFFLFFAAALRSHLRARLAPDGLLALGFGGAILLAAGFTTLLGLDFALADVPSKIDASAAQALNVLSNDVFFPFLLGSCVFYIGSGLAVLRSAALPRWLGAIALILGVVSVTPIGWFAFLIGALWVAVVAVMLVVRAGRSDAPAEATATPAVEREPATV